MSHMRHNQYTRAADWAKHLRPYGRRRFWKKERKALKRLIRRELTN